MLIYKYEKPECSRIDTLACGKIWMSLPRAFNDPLDCRLKLVDKTDMSTFDEQRIKQAAIDLYKDYGGNGEYPLWLITKEIVEAIRNWACGCDFSNEKPYFLSLIEMRIQGFGVQCFSEVLDSPLMWSHYAESHRGFCVEYDYKPLDLAFGNQSEFAMSPAIYTSLLPEFHLNEVLFSPREVTHKLYATKSEHWSYEREQRLIYFPCSPSGEAQGQLVELPDGLTITSIIAGLKTSECVKGKLRAAATSLGARFDLMTTDKISYSLTRQPETV